LLRLFFSCRAHSPDLSGAPAGTHDAIRIPAAVNAYKISNGLLLFSGNSGNLSILSLLEDIPNEHPAETLGARKFLLLEVRYA
jgi:hypothetical protein